MRMIFFYRKRVIIILLIIIALGAAIAGSFLINRPNKSGNTDIKPEKTINIVTANEELVLQKKTEGDGLVTGKDVLDKYSEMKGKDYAILVATLSYLEADRDVYEAEAEYPYIKYVIDEGRQNTAETIIDGNGSEIILSLVNYNAVLMDSCIYHKEESLLYETPLGFMEEDITANCSNEAGDIKEITYKTVYPLNNTEESINHITDKSLFCEAYLVDINSKIIGSIYIEQGEGSQ